MTDDDIAGELASLRLMVSRLLKHEHNARQRILTYLIDRFPYEQIEDDPKPPVTELK